MSRVATIKHEFDPMRDRSVAREEQVVVAAVLAEGSQPSSDVAAEIANRVDFASSSSDPMIAEVAAAVGEWKLSKRKNIAAKMCSRQQLRVLGLWGFARLFLLILKANMVSNTNLFGTKHLTLNNS
uniref:Uncharacterized protein n=1 Tax=Salix viminalis TaxID=40686 RepID=A0A6N2KIP8_SALVM